jgi:hypothetical protein
MSISLPQRVDGVVEEFVASLQAFERFRAKKPKARHRGWLRRERQIHGKVDVDRKSRGRRNVAAPL